MGNLGLPCSYTQLPDSDKPQGPVAMRNRRQLGAVPGAFVAMAAHTRFIGGGANGEGAISPNGLGVRSSARKHDCEAESRRDHRMRRMSQQRA